MNSNLICDFSNLKGASNMVKKNIFSTCH